MPINASLRPLFSGTCMELPLEYFWTLGKTGRKKSYYNSNRGKYEDMVVVTNGIAHYYLLDNEIATFDGKILMLTTAGWDTQTTWWRLSLIISYGRDMGYNIPLEPKMRVSDSGRKIYWILNGRTVIPEKYPIKVDVTTGEIHTKMVDVIPSFVIRPSRSKRNFARVKLRRIDGEYIIRSGVQYLRVMDKLFVLEDGLWVEVPIVSEA